MTYTFRNLITAFAIVVAVVLLILINTFYTFDLQEREIKKVRIAREVLLKLEPSQIHVHDFEDSLIFFFSVEKYQNTNFYKDALVNFNNDSLQLEELINSDSIDQNKMDYRNLVTLITQLKNVGKNIIQYKIITPDFVKLESEKNHLQKTATAYKVLAEKLQLNNRRVLRDSFGKSVSLARKTFVFTGIISGILILFLITAFLFRYKNIRYQSIYDFNLQKFRNALNNSADALYIIDRGRMRFIDVNDASCISTGYSREELLSTGPQHLRDQPAETLGREYDEIINSSSKKSMSYTKFFKKNGSSFEVEMSIQAMKDNKKDILITVARDITERKKAEQQLRKFSEELEQQVKEKTAEINKVFERVTDAFIALDKNWCYTYLNEKAELMHGRKAEDLIGKNIWVEYPDVVNEPLYMAVRKSMELQEEQRLQLYYSTTDRWFEDLIYPSPDGISIYYHDITERKKAELKLAESEEKYRTVIEQASDGIFIAGSDMYILDANNAGCEMLGFKVDELRKKRFIDFISPLTLVDNPIKVGELNSGNKVVNERILIRKDGSEFPVEISAQMISKGRYQSIIRDITERKKAEKLLKQSENKFRSLVDTAPDATVIVNEKGIIQIVNKQTELLLNYDRAELIGASVSKLIPEGWPDKHSIYQQSFLNDTLTRTMKPGRELFVVKKDGTHIPVEISLSPFNSDEGMWVTASIRDITERKRTEQILKESEKQLSIAAQIARLGYWEYDVVNNIFTFNDQFYSIFKTKGEKVGGYKMSAERYAELFMYPEDHHLIAVELEKAIRADDPYSSRQVEHRIKYADGETGFVLVNFYIVKDDHGRTIKTFGVNQDITARKKAEEELREYNNRFELITRTTNDAVWDWNFETNALWANQMHQQLYGLTLSDPVPTIDMWIEKIHPDDREIILKKQEETLSSDKNIFITEYRFKVEGKGYKNVYDRCYILRNKNGKPIRMMGSMMDITELKKAEQGIRTSEETRRLIMDSALDAIICINNEGFITVWTPQAEKIFGWKEQEVLGKSLSQTIIPLHYREKHIDGLINYRNSRESKIMNRLIELTALNKEGKEFPVELSITPIIQDETEFFCAFIRDITERKEAEEALKESEERYRTLVENAVEALVVLDMEKQKFVSVSDSAAKLFKLSKEKLLNFGPLELSPEFQPDGKLSSESAMEKLNEAVAGNKPAFEWTHFDADGNLLPCEIRLVRLPSENKILIRGSIIDITERKKAQDELKQSYESIRYLTDHLQNIREQERIHIAREIHDELGQQLTVLKMDISWLNKKIADADSSVKQKLKNLTEMLNGTVKTVRRISSELRPSLLDDLGLIAAMEWQLKEFEDRSGIKTTFVADETEVELSDSVKTGFFRIFQESLTNIARHANAKNVSTSLKNSDQKIILCIEDDGKGFDKKKIEDKRTLGILGMKERTLMMGGEYSINSIPGKGTIVLVVVAANK